jgi:predicted Zn-dependent protease with MMP-like domain
MLGASIASTMNKDAVSWSPLEAPSLDEIERLARHAFKELPEEFRALCGDVTIVVAEFAEDADLKELDIESPFDLLGLFQGVGMAHASATPSTGSMPNRIWLYRRPILDYWAEHEETLGDIVTHVLLHEIGHHFGLSDDDIDAIEAAAG